MDSLSVIPQWPYLKLSAYCDMDGFLDHGTSQRTGSSMYQQTVCQVRLNDLSSLSTAMNCRIEIWHMSSGNKDRGYQT